MKFVQLRLIISFQEVSIYKLMWHSKTYKTYVMVGWLWKCEKKSDGKKVSKGNRRFQGKNS